MACPIYLLKIQTTMLYNGYNVLCMCLCIIHTPFYIQREYEEKLEIKIHKENVRVSYALVGRQFTRKTVL